MFKLKNFIQDPLQLRKVAINGELAPFHGVTVISPCYYEHRDFFDAIYQGLQTHPLVKTYFALLPANSYHMTTMSLETEAQKGNSWNKFITKNLPRYQEIRKNLQINPLKPLIEKVELKVNSVISLTLLLNEVHETQIKKTAQALNLGKTVPSCFHITLAYSKPLIKLSRENTELLYSEINEQLQHVINKKIFPMEIEVPSLSYFNDMSAYYPWSAERNPFTIEIQKPHWLNRLLPRSRKHTSKLKKEAIL
ncbi:MAG: DUF1868 domain-containing protein [Legionella longbeachae]|nr:DUF1868 domain-containing protein [Legionella longbeachae]